MANEVLYSGQSDTALAEVAAQELLLIAKDRAILGNHSALIYAGDLKGSKSSTIQLSSVGWGGYDLLGDTGENASLANTALTDASASIAVARKATKYSVSELVTGTGADLGIFRDPELLAMNVLLAREVKLRDMICNVGDGFTTNTAVGSTGVDLTVENIMSARAALEGQGVQGPYICILHTQQWYDLQVDMKAETGLDSLPKEMLSVANGVGWKGRFFGDVDFFVTSSVPTANAGADRAGCMFGHGAIAYADMTVEQNPYVPATGINLGKAQVRFDIDISSGQENVVFETYLGVAIVQDACGVSIITDA